MKINLTSVLQRIIGMRWMYESIRHGDEYPGYDSDLFKLKREYEDGLWQVVEYEPVSEDEVSELGYYMGLLMQFDPLCPEAEEALLMHYIECRAKFWPA